MRRLMSKGRWALMAAVLGVPPMAYGQGAPSQQPSYDQLQQQVQALQSRVQSLESERDRSADVDATVKQILNDADRRSQLLAAEGFTAGYNSDRGFVLQSSDGSYLLHPYIQWQVRNTSNYRESVSPGGDSDTENGFEIRRLQFGFDGNVIAPELSYRFQWQTDRTNGSVSLQDAWARYKFADDWSVRAGQFKDPLGHEQLLGSFQQLAADRSLLNTILQGNDDYIQGIGLSYDNGERLRAEGVFHDGFNGSNSNFLDPVDGLTDAGFVANNKKSYNWGVSGRVEYLVLGEAPKAWKQYQDFSAWGNKEDLLVAGAGADFSQSGDTNVLHHTVDLQWEPQAIKGLSVYGAYVARFSDIAQVERSTQEDNAYDWGYLAQAGYLLTSNFEVFARYDYTRLDTGGLSASAARVSEDLHEITAGVNYYLKGQKAKFTADLTYLPDGSPISADGLGILSQTDDSAQWVGRLQLQLLL